jgi:hypothetical protein
MSVRVLLRSAMFVSVLTGLAAPASAIDVTARVFADVADPDLSIALCGRGPGDSDCSLRAAIQQANASPDPDELHIIRLLPGHYVLSIAGSGEDDAATGDLDIRRNITIVGEGPLATTIRADRIDRVFHLLGGFVSIRNVTIQMGSTTGDGGGIWNEAAFNALISNVTLVNNDASRGAAIAANAGTEIRNSVLAANISRGCGGGLSVSHAAVGLVDSVVEVNVARRGGGVCVSESTSLGIHRTSIISNDADSGGGIYTTSGLEVSVIVTDSFILRNRAHRGFGGGGMMSGGLFQVHRTEIAENEARYTLGGGGILNFGRLHVSESYVHDNRAFGSLVGGGGGIFTLGAELIVTRSTIARNSAGVGGGGGIFITKSTNDPLPTEMLRVENTTVSGNAARLGGSAIFTTQPGVLLNHVTVAENTTTFGAALQGPETGFNTVGALVGQNHGSAPDGRGRNCWRPAYDGPSFTSLADDDSCGFHSVHPVLLDPLADNGGPTPTHALNPGSPAVELSTDCGSTSAARVHEDQRGLPRPQGLSCDSGAYELQPVTSALRFFFQQNLFNTLIGTARVESHAMAIAQAAVASKDQEAIASAEQLLSDARALSKAGEAFATSADPAAAAQQFGAIEMAVEKVAKAFAAFTQCCSDVAEDDVAALSRELSALQALVPELRAQVEAAITRTPLQIMVARVEALELPRGLTNSLVKQLAAGAFEAVIRHLSAQSGRAIDVDTANALIADVRILIGL